MESFNAPRRKALALFLAAATIGLSARDARAALDVNANADVHPISPYIYGTAANGDAYQRTMGTSVSRWGGNQVTRYNWESEDSNAGADWGLCVQGYLGRGAFSNVDYGSVSGESLRSSAQGAGPMNMAFLFTVPTMGWVARDGSNSTCSTGVPGNDGPPINGNGAITGYDPTANRNATSVRSQMRKGAAFVYPPNRTDGVVYQDELISYIVSQVGRADAGGIKFYAFDNEYDLWSHTHRDVHPSRIGYDALLAKFIEFADAIKAIDPSAMTTGPVSWGWTNFWYSPLDAGSDNYGTRADRAAHGNVPLLQWFLRKMREHDTQVGRRTLDVLDVHFYPQAGQYGNDASASMQALRLRSTRDLWDPTYTTESWMNCCEGGPQIQVIRRLKSWINQEYPGTKLGITEWNWGADNHINGALTIADILGIFGREDVYLANYWTTPEDRSPGYWAWRMFRNVDGNFTGFGDTSVQAAAPTSDVDRVAVYASRDSATGQLKIMVVNKMPSTAYTTAINLSNFAPSGTGRVYQYSQADTAQIRRLADLTGVGATLNRTFDPYSITLLILDGGAAPGNPPPAAPKNLRRR